MQLNVLKKLIEILLRLMTEIAIITYLEGSLCSLSNKVGKLPLDFFQKALIQRMWELKLKIFKAGQHPKQVC